MALKKRDHLRLYDSIDVVRYKYQAPTISHRYYEKLKADVLKHGMRHPVICAWDEPANDFRVVVGNNRLHIMSEFDKTHARALFLGPQHVRWPAGEYEQLLFDDNLNARLHALWDGHDFRSAMAYPWTALTELRTYTTEALNT